MKKEGKNNAKTWPGLGCAGSPSGLQTPCSCSWPGSQARGDQVPVEEDSSTASRPARPAPQRQRAPVGWFCKERTLQWLRPDPGGAVLTGVWGACLNF